MRLRLGLLALSLSTWLFLTPASLVRAQLPRECLELIEAQTRAANGSDWESLVTSSRQYMSLCGRYLNADDQSHALNMMAIGLGQQGKHEQALPILKRCLTIKPDAAFCATTLGEELSSLGRPTEALEQYRRAIEIGGYDQVNGSAVDLARKRVAEISALMHGAEQRRKDKEEQEPESTKRTSSGTGFFVTPKGHIVTNNHVVEGCSSIQTRDGHELSVVAIEPASDLAIVKGDFEPRAVATLRREPRVRAGENVVVFGFPLPGILSSGGNVATGALSAVRGVGDRRHLWQITAPVQPGNSGGPLLDQSGNVIGVVVGKLDTIKVAEVTGDIPQNVNFAVSLDALDALLAEAQIFPRRRPSGAVVKTADIAEKAKAFSLAVICKN